MTYDEARALGYEIDQVVPLSLIDAALPQDEESRIIAFQLAQDLENLRMIPGAENIRKHSRIDMEEYQDKAFFSLRRKHGVLDNMINEVIPC